MCLTKSYIYEGANWFWIHSLLTPDLFDFLFSLIIMKIKKKLSPRHFTRP